MTFMNSGVGDARVTPVCLREFMYNAASASMDLEREFSTEGWCHVPPGGPNFVPESLWKQEIASPCELHRYFRLVLAKQSSFFQGLQIKLLSLCHR